MTMFAEFRRLFVLVLLICVPAAGAQVCTQAYAQVYAQAQPAEPKPAEHTVADVIKWVKRDGQEAVFSHGAARIFGWGDDNVMVTRMAFANPETKDNFAFDVLRDKPNTVLTWRGSSEMVIWQMSESGQVLKTLHVDKDGAKPVDNALFQSKWQETLAVFFELIPATPAATGQ
jgi:hypothetical protein